MVTETSAGDQAADSFATDVLERARNVVAIEAAGVSALGRSLDGNFVHAVRALLDMRGRAIVCGLGKSGHVGTKIAATLASTGTPAFFLHAAEAAHGDMGMIARDDIVILISNSGETAELLPIIQHLKSLEVRTIGISSAPRSRLIRGAEIPLVLPPAGEACPVGIAPTTSTTMMLALGDALAMAVMEKRGFTRDDFRRLHPGGSIGLKLAKVSEFMHRGDRLPLVGPDTPMSEVIVTMTSKSFGIAGVTDRSGELVGVITDGDLRRHIGDITGMVAHQVMTTTPRIIDASMPAEDALKFLNLQKVTALFVVDDAGVAGRPIGIVHVHDFLRLGLLS